MHEYGVVGKKSNNLVDYFAQIRKDSLNHE